MIQREFILIPLLGKEQACQLLNGVGSLSKDLELLKNGLNIRKDFLFRKIKKKDGIIKKYLLVADFAGAAFFVS